MEGEICPSIRQSSKCLLSQLGSLSRLDIYPSESNNGGIQAEILTTTLRELLSTLIGLFLLYSGFLVFYLYFIRTIGQMRYLYYLLSLPHAFTSIHLLMITENIYETLSSYMYSLPAISILASSVNNIVVKRIKNVEETNIVISIDIIISCLAIVFVTFTLVDLLSHSKEG